MRPLAQSNSGPGRFDPDLIVVLDWLCKPVVALGATTKSYDNWSGHLRPRPLVGFVYDKNVGGPKVPPHFQVFYRMGTWCPPYNLSVVIGVARGVTPINSHPLLSAEERLHPSAALRVGNHRKRHRASRYRAFFHVFR